jgi:ketosteroid isomerase-like protein
LGVTTQENKELALSWFEAMYSREDRWRSMIHDDFRYWAIGRWQDVDGFIDEVERHASGPYTLKIGDVTAEDDRVVIEAEPSYDLPNGRNYTNFYVFSVRIRDGKILRYRAHLDTLHAYRIFDGPPVFDPEVRESPFEEVLRTFLGPSPKPASSTTED